MPWKQHDIVLQCQGVHKTFGTQRVLGDVNLGIARGQFVSLVGGSGSGKSTLLNMIVGTHTPTLGSVLAYREGSLQEVVGHGPDRGMVYQNYALLPHLTAIHNVALGPMFSQSTIPGRTFGQMFGSWREKRKQQLTEAEKLLVRLGLGDVMNKFPAKLSGGERQRVAIARSLIMKPGILLLDEPFSGLDEGILIEVRNILRALYQENVEACKRGEAPPLTVIVVTHSLQDAVRVSDRVIGISRHWNHEAEDLKEHPGSSIVYDDLAPVYSADDILDAGRIMHQAKEIYRVVLEGRNLSRTQHCRFWDRVAAGEGHGVMQFKNGDNK